MCCHPRIGKPCIIEDHCLHLRGRSVFFRFLLIFLSKVVCKIAKRKELAAHHISCSAVLWPRASASSRSPAALSRLLINLQTNTATESLTVRRGGGEARSGGGEELGRPYQRWRSPVFARTRSAKCGAASSVSSFWTNLFGTVWGGMSLQLEEDQWRCEVECPTRRSAGWCSPAAPRPGASLLERRCRWLTGWNSDTTVSTVKLMILENQFISKEN